MQNDVLSPNEVRFKDILVNCLWTFVAWVSGSIFLLVLVLVSSRFYDIPWEFASSGNLASTKNIFFPFFLSFITFVVTEIVLFASYIFLTYTDPDKYERSHVTYVQIAFVSTLIYLFITPIYLYAGMVNYDNIMYVFVGHILILFFSLMVILEILNNYRYILVWLYSSIVSILLTWTIAILIFGFFDSGTAKLIALMFMLPLVNFLCVFFKWLFEFVYYLYYKHTGSDNLWDIFRQLELEAKEQLKQATEENSI